MQNILELIEKPEFLHRVTARYDDRFFAAFQAGKLIHRVGTEIKVAG